jgi:signal transduction histidine kinase
MRRGSVLSGSAFRSAVWFSLVFVVVLGVAGALIVAATRQAIVAQLKIDITEDVNLLREADTAGGERELTRFVQNAVATRSDKQFAFGLFHPKGARIAGNLTVRPHFEGFGVLPREPNLGADDDDFLGYAEMVGGILVVVGRSEEAMSAVGDGILVPLIIAGLVICASALAIGYLLSRNVSAKLQVIDDTLAEVGRGNTAVRIPAGQFDDQIEHVSRQINTHLTRLSEFMGLMRNTIVSIAHDLKSPLSRASILLQDAASDEPPDRAKVDRAMAELDTLSGTLDTVLRISRIETSEDKSGFKSFPAAPMLRELAQTFEPVVEANGQTLAVTIPEGDGPSIFGDPRMIQQMLVNLIENASRHNGAGIQITLALASRAGEAVVVVADNGIGVPPEMYDEVFQPFRRLETARHTSGTGLGLALVRAIATRHRAHIDLADNRPGLRVEVRFPAVLPPF